MCGVGVQYLVLVLAEDEVDPVSDRCYVCVNTWCPLQHLGHLLSASPISPVSHRPRCRTGGPPAQSPLCPCPDTWGGSLCTRGTSPPSLSPPPLHTGWRTPGVQHYPPQHTGYHSGVNIITITMYSTPTCCLSMRLVWDHWSLRWPPSWDQPASTHEEPEKEGLNLASGTGCTNSPNTRDSLSLKKGCDFNH